MKDLLDEIDSRIKSPFFGYFLFSALAVNWSPLFYLMMHDGEVSSRIEYFQGNTDFLSLFVCPFLIAATYSVAYPWLQFVFTYTSIKPTELRNALQARSEHKLIEVQKNLEVARNNTLKIREEELIDRAKRDEELNEIEDKSLRNKLQSEIDALRSERDKLKNEKPEKISSSQLSDDQIEILKVFAEKSGDLYISDVRKRMNYEQIKTEYLVEDLESNGYLERSYDSFNEQYMYKLTTKSKKLLVEIGVAK